MISTTLIYILAGVSALYLLVFFGLMRIKFFNKARQEYFSYYRKPINEVARGSAMKALFIWRAINIIIYIILIAILIGGFFAWQYFGAPGEKVQKQPILPTACQDEPEGPPVITSLSSYSGSVGARFEIKGCNFSGFEGDKNAWIENSQGIKGLLRGEAESTSKLLKVTLSSPLCQKNTSYSGMACDVWLTLTPGVYKIYTLPWGKKSNEVNFTVK